MKWMKKEIPAWSLANGNARRRFSFAFVTCNLWSRLILVAKKAGRGVFMWSKRYPLFEAFWEIFILFAVDGGFVRCGVKMFIALESMWESWELKSRDTALLSFLLPHSVRLKIICLHSRKRKTCHAQGHEDDAQLLFTRLELGQIASDRDKQEVCLWAPSQRQ